MPRRDVSIIIPCFNKVDYTVRCLTSLAEHTPADRYEVVIVDNASSDATPDLCAQLEGDVTAIRNDVNLGFSKACNQGAAAATGRHLLFLNNDTEALPGWLEPMLDIIESEPDVGAVGSKLLFPDDTLQHAGVIVTEVEGGVPISATHEHYRLPKDHPPANFRRDMDIVTGACVLFRREAFEAAGGFDEGYWNGYEDVDLCLSLRDAGWRVVYEPASSLYHHESVSGPERFRKVDANVQRLQDRWGGRYIPPWLLTTDQAARAHPLRNRTEIVITGPPVGQLAFERTLHGARRALRGDDTICVDPALGALVLTDHPKIRVGIPDPTAEYRLDLHAGIVIDRSTLDCLLVLPLVDDVTEAGPVFSDGVARQSVDAWVGPMHRSGHTARRRALLTGVNQWALVDHLDARCVLRRMDRASRGGRRIAVRGAYAESIEHSMPRTSAVSAAGSGR